MTTVPPLANTTATTAFLDRIAHAQHGARSTDAPATQRTYVTAARAFATWATAQGLAPSYPIDPRTVAAFVDALSEMGRAPSTVRTYIAGINRAHRDLDMPGPGDSDVVRLALQRLARTAAKKVRCSHPGTVTMAGLRDHLDGPTDTCST